MKKENINKLFFSKTGASLTRFTLYRYFENITEVLGIEKEGIHILRHTFANNLNNLEIDLADIQEAYASCGSIYDKGLYAEKF